MRLRLEAKNLSLSSEKYAKELGGREESIFSSFRNPPLTSSSLNKKLPNSKLRHSHKVMPFACKFYLLFIVRERGKHHKKQ